LSTWSKETPSGGLGWEFAKAARSTLQEFPEEIFSLFSFARIVLF